MKTGIHLALIFILLLVFPSPASSQMKTIEWYTFSMGYDVSSSTQYVIKSVMGQNFVDTSQQSLIHLGSGFLTDTLLQRLTFTSILSVSGAWNLLSIPVAPNGNLKTFLFPTAISSAFAYSGGYVTRDALQHGVGYWLKFRSDESINFLGEPMFCDTMRLSSRWNIIGSISVRVAVKDIQSIPPGLVVSNFFSYDPATDYVIADSIAPGRGYWVKANQAGYLILNPPPTLAGENRIKIVSDCELPPPPPEVTGRGGVPKEFALSQNYPNPFNPATTIAYQIPVSSYVTLKVYNLLGQEVATLLSGDENPGMKSVEWNAAGLSSGVYFYELKAVDNGNSTKSFTQLKKTLFIK